MLSIEPSNRNLMNGVVSFSDYYVTPDGTKVRFSSKLLHVDQFSSFYNKKVFIFNITSSSSYSLNDQVIEVH